MVDNNDKIMPELRRGLHAQGENEEQAVKLVDTDAHRGYCSIVHRTMVEAMNRRLSDRLEEISEENQRQHECIMEHVQKLEESTQELHQLMQPFEDMVRMADGFAATSNLLNKIGKLRRPIAIFLFTLVLLFSDLISWLKTFSVWIKQLFFFT